MKKPQERELAEDSTQASQPQEEPAEAAELGEDVDLNLDNGLGEEQDDADDEPAEEEAIDDLPEKTWPTLEEYKAKWDAGLAKHSRANAGPFSRNNLVPEPIHALWQDAAALVRRSILNRAFLVFARFCLDCSLCQVPYVPFDQLKTDDAIARLSRCRLWEHMLPVQTSASHSRQIPTSTYR